MLSIIKQMAGKKSLNENQKLQKQISSFIKNVSKNYSDEAEILKYNQWLKSKLNKTLSCATCL